MNRRTSVALIGGLVLAVAPLTVAGPASAATRPAVAPATLIATTTTMTATETVGTTGPKVTFAIRVKAASGAIPQGSVTLTVTPGTTSGTLTLKPTGRISYTHHYKVGSYTATATYKGSATDAGSTVTVTVNVT